MVLQQLPETEGNPPFPLNGGYARIREVYALIQWSEDRLVKKLEDMEERLTEKIEKGQQEQNDRWQKHLEESQDIRTKLASMDEQALLTATYQQGKLAAPRTLGRTVDWIESHWRTMSFLGVLLAILLDVAFNFHVFGLHFLPN